MLLAPGFIPHVIVFLAATATTVTGYGFVVLSAPLLALVMPPPQVVPLTLGLGLLLVTALLMNPAVWRAIDVKLAFQLSGAGLIGIPFGAALLDVLSQDTLRVVLGGAVALSALGPTMARRDGRFGRVSHGRATVYVTGLIAGLLSGCVGLNGPPVALLLAWRGAEKERLRATPAAVVWLLSTTTLLFLAASGRVPDGLAFDAIAFVPALVIGWLAGSLVFQTVPVPWFPQLSLVFAAVAGLTTAAVGLHR